MPKHVATVRLDACIMRTSYDQTMHTVVIENGGKCEHSHQAWEPCGGCLYNRAALFGKHEDP